MARVRCPSIAARCASTETSRRCPIGSASTSAPGFISPSTYERTIPLRDRRSGAARRRSPSSSEGRVSLVWQLPSKRRLCRLGVTKGGDESRESSPSDAKRACSGAVEGTKASMPKRARDRIDTRGASSRAAAGLAVAQLAAMVACSPGAPATESRSNVAEFSTIPGVGWAPANEPPAPSGSAGSGDTGASPTNEGNTP